MSNIETKLLRCFEAVFPTLTSEQIHKAVRDDTPQWDSLASLLLARTIQEEFGLEGDLELMDHLDSFETIRTFLTDRLGASSAG